MAEYTPTGLPSLDLGSSTTYGDRVPSAAKTGDVIQFGEKLRGDSPQITSLMDQGYLSPYGAPGEAAVFTKSYYGGQPMRAQEYTPEGSPFEAGPTRPTPTAPPNVSYNYQVRPLAPEVKNEYKENLKHQLTSLMGGQNLPSGADLDYYINAMAHGGYTAQDIANDWTEQRRGEVGRTIGKRIVSPDVQRWHWIVGAEGGPDGGPLGAEGEMGGGPTDLGEGGEYIPGMEGDMEGVAGGFGEWMRTQGLGEPEVSELAPMQLPDIVALSKEILANDEFTQARLKSSEEGYKSLLNSIERQYDQMYKETSFKADQARGQQRAYLARLGALGNNTAASGMLQGMRDAKDDTLNKIQQSREAAKVAAYQAWQTGDMEILQKAYENAKDLAVAYTDNLAEEWNSRKESKQLGVNEYQAKSNYLLGAYGKLLQAEGVDIERMEAEGRLEQMARNWELDQAKFEQLKKVQGDESALAWAELLGYHVDPETGEIWQTLDMMAQQLKSAKGKDGSGNRGTQEGAAPPTELSSLAELSSLVEAARSAGDDNQTIAADLTEVGYSPKEIEQALYGDVLVQEPELTFSERLWSGGVGDAFEKMMDVSEKIMTPPEREQSATEKWLKEKMSFLYK